MPHYPEDQNYKNLDRIRRENVCGECGRQLYLYLDREKKLTYIACPTPGHEGISKEYQPQSTDYRTNLRREHEMEQKHGRETSRVLQTLPKKGQLTKQDAEHILSLVYPGVPEDEIIRCAILCRDYGLHPLMKEVYIIPFKKKWKDKDEKWHEETTWSTVLGINATRKLMAQRGTYSYIDDTPRIMTEVEQNSIFGEVDTKNFVAITKLRTKDGLEAPGYGKWPKDKEPYGTDKGNSKANMAFIRSERNAFGRLSPDALPQDVEIIDEAYAEVPKIERVVDKGTGEITETEVVEGEAIEQAEATESKSSASEENNGGIVAKVDFGWLKEAMKKIKWTADDTAIRFIKSKAEFKGLDTEGTLEEVLARMSKEQQEKFVEMVQELEGMA